MTHHDQLRAKLEAAQWKQRELPGFIGAAGPLWTRREADAWAYGLLAQGKHLNPAGVVHGGALLTLVDHAISAVAWEASGRLPCVTLQLDTHFADGVREAQFVQARAEVVQRSASLLFMRASLTVEDRLVLSAQAIMKIIRVVPGRS